MCNENRQVLHIYKYRIFKINLISLFLGHKTTTNPQPNKLKESAPVSLRGSLSVEAGMVIPIFLFFMMTIILGIEMVRLQTNVFEALHEEFVQEFEQRSTDSGAFYEYLDSKENVYLCADGKVELRNDSLIDTNGKIQLTATYSYKPFIDWMSVKIGQEEDSVFGHSFTGYAKMIGTIDVSKNEYVYITKTGVKYHRSPDCSYINVTPRAIEAVKLESHRNSSGGKYYPCKTCQAKKNGIIYITGDGSSYHKSADCSALKRSVRVITVKEAVESGYTPCSKCG